MSLVLDVQTVSVLIASASIVAGAIYYMLETRHQRVVRQTDNILRMSPWFDMKAKEMQENIALVCSAEYSDYNDYMSKYAGKPEHLALKILGNYFEGIGLLVYRKLAEVKLVYDFWGDISMSLWEENEELILSMRKETGAPRMFEYWEFMAKEMKKKRREPGFPSKS